MLFLAFAVFFKINFFEKLYEETHFSVKQFGPRSGLTFWLLIYTCAYSERGGVLRVWTPKKITPLSTPSDIHCFYPHTFSSIFMCFIQKHVFYARMPNFHILKDCHVFN